MLSEETLNLIRKENKIIYYVVLSFMKLLEKNNLRDLGKILAEGNEYVQKDWINENTIIKVKKRNDGDLNGSGYDLISEDNLLKINSKIRSTTFHLENTRRKSKKNENSSSTGHVAYTVGESDVYFFSKPNTEDYGSLEKWEFIAVPESELIDSENPKYLVTNVPKKVLNKFIGKTKETLENLHSQMLTNKKNLS